MTERFEILEHTADVGLQAEGPTCEAVFEALGEGLATLLGAWFPDGGEERAIALEASDREALLVSWLDELLYLHEAHDAVFARLDVGLVEEHRMRATVGLAPRGDRELEGGGVKAATYHRLLLAREPGGSWRGRVYVDV